MLLGQSRVQTGSNVEPPIYRESKLVDTWPIGGAMSPLFGQEIVQDEKLRILGDCYGQIISMFDVIYHGCLKITLLIIFGFLKELWQLLCELIIFINTSVFK